MLLNLSKVGVVLAAEQQSQFILGGGGGGGGGGCITKATEKFKILQQPSKRLQDIVNILARPLERKLTNYKPCLTDESGLIKFNKF